MSLKLRSITAVLVGPLLFTSGCKTIGQKTEAITEAPFREIRFESLDYFESVRVTRDSDVKTVVEFALKLAQEGRHEASGQILEEAAEKVVSKDQELNIRLQIAAANEYLRAGNREGFLRALNRAEESANRFQRASFDKDTRMLLALKKIATEKGADEAVGIRGPSSLQHKNPSTTFFKSE